MGSLRRRGAHGRAGAHDQAQRHHRVVGAPRDGDVPARQPRRRRLLGVHVGLVLRGAEARARAHGVPPPLPPRPRAHGGGAARGAVRVRPGAAARDAHAPLLRRGTADSVVPALGRVARRAGDPGGVRARLRGRGPARRRLPQVHAARPRALGRRRSRRVLEGRGPDGEQRPQREAPPPDQPARQPEPLPERHRPEPAARAGVARPLAGRADPVRSRLRAARRPGDPAKPLGAVRRNLRDSARSEPVPQGAVRDAGRGGRVGAGGIGCARPGTADRRRWTAGPGRPA